MQTRWKTPLIFVMILVSRLSVNAQDTDDTHDIHDIHDSGQGDDTPRFGVTMGYPVSVGLVLRMTGSVAVRPELSLSRTSIDSSGTGGVPSSTTSDGSTVGVGVSALFYVRTWENLRTYVSPRFSYTRSTSSTGSNAVGNSHSDNTSTSYSGAGSLGAEYSLGRRFAVFGETGVGYTNQKTSLDANVFRSETRTHSWSTRTGVGVIFRF